MSNPEAAVGSISFEEQKDLKTSVCLFAFIQLIMRSSELCPPLSTAPSDESDKRVQKAFIKERDRSRARDECYTAVTH